MNVSINFRSVMLAIALLPCFVSNAIAANLYDHKTYDIDQFAGSDKLCFQKLKKYAAMYNYLNWDVNNSRKEIVHEEDLGYYREKDASIIHMRCQSNGKLYISVRVPDEDIYRYQQDAGEVVPQRYEGFIEFLNGWESQD